MTNSQRFIQDDIDNIKGEVTLDDLYGIGQIRLSEMSICNWGSFTGIRTATIHPEGTLITGETGSGKSTFIDGYTALLQGPSKASFNMAAAQNDKSDRSLISYMRGSYGMSREGANTKAKNKRESAVLSGLRALHTSDDGSLITLVALFWTGQVTQDLSDVKRMYIVAHCNLSLESIIEHFDASNMRGLNEWLRSNASVVCHTKDFTEYQTIYQKSLYMENKNAPNLLNRALGLKKVDDLTRIIRELVLEPSSIKQDILGALNEFNDMVSTYDKLVDHRKQRDHLKPLIDINISLKKSTEKTNLLGDIKEALPRYINKKAEVIASRKKTVIEDELATVQSEIKQNKSDLDKAEIKRESRHKAFIDAGGDRLEDISQQLKVAKQSLDTTILKANKYQESMRKLGLSEELDLVHFEKNKLMQEDKLSEQNELYDKETEAFAQASTKYSNQNSKKGDLENEIKEIEQRPDSNIDVKYQSLRDQIVSDLSLEPSCCMFIGELIDVKETEKGWQGAIERALGIHRLTLAVPAHNYGSVTRWLNSHHTGLYVRVQVVEEIPNKAPIFKTDGLCRKLIWREHDYRQWVKHYLANYDLHCIDNVDLLNKTPYSMTKEGLSHLSKGRFEKKDQYKVEDRRQWCLGFSNKSRLSILRNDLVNLESEVERLLGVVGDTRKSLDNANELAKLWEGLGNTDWDDIKSPYWLSEIEELNKEKERLEGNDDALKTAKELWDEAKSNFKDFDDKKGDLQKQLGRIEQDIESLEAQITRIKSGAEGVIETLVEQALSELVTPISDEDFDNLSLLQTQYSRNIDEKYKNSSDDENRYQSQAVKIMAEFRSQNKWQEYALDWKTDKNAIPDYLNYLDELEKNGLPELETRWRTRLNNNITESLAKIKHRLDSERDDIKDRIEMVSNVLERTEFMEGSYLKLSTKVESFPNVTEFNKEVAQTLALSTTDDHELRYAKLSSVMELLRVASDSVTGKSLESLRLIDTRYQMTFIAEQCDRETDEIEDIWISSSSKSGGEKESFSGAIVAASLAYVLTPDGYDRPIYSTVFLDEAFSNTSESVSRRILKIFKELNIHINLITPYKNLNLAKESAKSILIFEIDKTSHESQISDVDWEMVEAKINEHRRRKGLDDAEQLGVEVE